MKCSVCQRDGAQPLRAIRPEFTEDHDARKTRIRWVPAESPGAACSPECATLVYVKPRAGMTRDEIELSAWTWRARRAEVRGEEFTEPPPLSEGDRMFLVQQSLRRGLELRRGNAVGAVAMKGTR
jgi:hypothetical protein